MNEEIGESEIMAFYNATKRGTDTFDQLQAESSMAKQWPMHLFFAMLDQAGLNSAILYNLREDNPALNCLSFLKELAFSL